jgi:hypothetical protein
VRLADVMRSLRSRHLIAVSLTVFERLKCFGPGPPFRIHLRDWDLELTFANKLRISITTDDVNTRAYNSATQHRHEISEAAVTALAKSGHGILVSMTPAAAVAHQKYECVSRRNALIRAWRARRSARFRVTRRNVDRALVPIFVPPCPMGLGNTKLVRPPPLFGRFWYAHPNLFLASQLVGTCCVPEGLNHQYQTTKCIRNSSLCFSDGSAAARHQSSPSCRMSTS